MYHLLNSVFLIFRRFILEPNWFAIIFYCKKIPTNDFKILIDHPMILNFDWIPPTPMI